MQSPGQPRFFYGYVIVAACFVVLYMLWGMVLNTLPVFLKPVVDSMNWGRGPFLMALIMGALGTTVSAPIAGRMIDRLGARPVMAVGTVVIGLGLLSSSQITQLWHLYLIFALVGGGLMCATIIPCSLVIGNWFISRRGMAMSGAFVGTSFGGMIMSPIAEWIIRTYGWRTAFACSGISILVIVLPVIFFLIRTHPSELGLEPYRKGGNQAGAGRASWGFGAKEAFSMPVFWQIAGIMLVIGVVTGGVYNNLAAYLTDLGQSSQSAAFVLSAVNGVMVLGKFAFGPAADRWGARNAMTSACVLFALSIVVLTFARPYSVALVFAAIYGFASGAPLVLNALLTADYLGMKNFGAIYGILTITANLGGAISPAGAGFFFDKYSTYLPVFYAFVGVMAVGIFVCMSMRPPPAAAEIQAG